MKAMLACLLLLPACADKVPYDYSLTWVCVSPEGCERADALKLFNRLNVNGDVFFFLSTREDVISTSAQRLGSDSSPDGCSLLYGLALFGREVEPSKLCSTSGGFDLELAIPNRNPATESHWIVEVRELGII